MSVVERCPNCGTTQATAGECEACHEAQVRYFCTKHELWLDRPTCPRSGVMPVARPVERPVATPTVASPRVEPFWEKLLKNGAIARRAEPTPAPRLGRWVFRIALRLVLVVVIMIIALVGAVYWLAHSLST